MGKYFVLLGAIICFSSGCSGAGGRVPMPDLTPEEAASKALVDFDTNNDGLLDSKELEKCPALKNALKSIDKNGDGKLSANEIADRLASFQASRVGLMSFGCKVLLDGQPLSGATVTFVPERFLGPGFKSASGVTDPEGQVSLQTEGADTPGIQFGYYRIEVSKKGGGSQESIPARYNKQTVLGQEVAPGGRAGAEVVLRLTSR